MGRGASRRGAREAAGPASALRREARERELHALFEWGVRDVGAEATCALDLLLSISEFPKTPGEVVLGPGCRAGAVRPRRWIRIHLATLTSRLLLRGLPRGSRLLALAPHEVGPVRLFGRVLVVGATQEARVLDGRDAALADGLHVVVLEPAARLATAAVGTHERALPAVSLADGAPHVGRDVARGLGAPTARARIVGCRGLAPLELRDQRVERAIEDLARVAVRDRMAEQVLRALQLVANSRPHPELQFAGPRIG